MIIGLSGSFAAGKGVAVDYLVKNHGFKHYSMSGFIKEEIVKRGMPVNRDSMIVVSNDLRKKNGPTFIIDSLYKKAEEAGGNIVIESLRAVAEVRRIKELGGFVIGIDADPEIRYKRAVARDSEKDRVSFEHWLDQEKRESNPDDSTKQDIFGALKESNCVISNNVSPESMYEQIDKVVESLT